VRRTSRKSHGREASENGDVVSNALYSRTTDTSDRSSNDTIMFSALRFLKITFGLSQQGLAESFCNGDL